MVKTDLSKRQALTAASIPSFNQRDHTTGTLVDSGIIFNPKCACTVQWIIAQVSFACTIQLLSNNKAIGGPLYVTAGSIIRFSGMLLTNNNNLSLSLSVANSVTFDVAWVKDFLPELIVHDTSVFSNTTSLNRKTTVESKTPLLANAIFTSPWHDSELDGTAFVVASVYTDQAGSGTGQSFRIEESDDITNANFTRTVSSSSSSPAYSANALQRGWGIIKARYWRIVIQNGGINQTVFELTSAAFNYIPAIEYPGGSQMQAGSNNQPVSATIAASGLASGDNQANTAVTSFSTYNNSSTASGWQGYPFLFNGTGWDRARNNWSTTTGDTGAKTVTFNGLTQTNFDSAGAFITILLGVVSGTTPTLSIQLQWSPDNGTTWLNLGAALPNLTLSSQTGLIAVYPANFSQTPGATPANMTTGATVQMLLNSPLPRTWRLVYTIAGTTPSFTISSVQVNYMKN